MTRLFVWYLGALSVLALGGVGPVRYRGVYANTDYGFRVTIPSGNTGVGAAENAPNHGFVIRLSDTAQISVSASYDAGIDSENEDWKQQMLRVHGRPTENLGGLPAWRLLSYDETRRKHVELITGRRNTGTDVPIIYSISLETPSVPDETSVKVFDAIRRSFRLEQIAK
jgi:hypothetical protein